MICKNCRRESKQEGICIHCGENPKEEVKAVKKDKSSANQVEKKGLPKWAKISLGCCGGAVLLFLILIIVSVIITWGEPRLNKIKSPTNQSPIKIAGTTDYKESKIEFYLDGNKITETKSDNKGKFSTNVELKEEKEHKIKAKAINQKGKVKESTESSVIYDITPPQPPTLKDYPKEINQNKTEIGVETEKNSKVALYRDKDEIKSGTTDKDGKLKLKDVGLNEGENKLYAKATDEAGNTSRESEVIVIVYNKKIETSTPTITSTPTPTPKPAEKTNETIEYQLAKINKGGFVEENDISINRFRYLLEEIDSKTIDDKQSVSDKTVKGWQLLRTDFGKDISLLEFMEQANDSIPTGRHDWKYEEIVAALIILLGNSH